MDNNHIFPSYLYSSCNMINRDILLLTQMKDYMLDLIQETPIEIFNSFMNSPNNNISAYYIKKLLPTGFKEKRNNRDLCPVRPVKPRREAREHLRVQACFQRLALRRIGKDLGGQAPALGGIGDQVMHDVVRVERRRAELVQITRKEGFATGNPSC